MNLKKIFSIMKGFRVQYLVFLLIAAIAMGLRQICFARLLRELFDATVALNATRLWHGVVVNVSLLLGLSILQATAMYFSQKGAVRITVRFRTQLYDRMKDLPIAFFKNQHSGDLISRFNNDLQQLEAGYGMFLIQLCLFSISGLTSIIYMFILDWRIALIALITAGVGLLVSTLYAQPLRRVGEVIQQRLGVMTQAFSDIYAGLPVIKSFNLQKEIYDRFGRTNQDVFDSSMDRVKLNAELVTFNFVTRWLDILGFVLIAAFFAINGWVTVGTVVAISQLKNPINAFFMQVGGFITNIQASLAAGTRIFEVFEHEPEPKVYDHLPTSAKPEPDYSVVINNLNFGYVEGQNLIKNLTLKVKKGTKVALAGPSGEGKSTIFKLLLGFYAPLNGEIVVNGMSLGSKELSDIRKTMAYVPQNAHLFTGTIKDNIRWGNENATDEEVIHAAQVANAHDFIMAFEKGYDTRVGERGAQLSGGQRQRIAIARAVLKNAPILLLDEATSSLDTESEAVVQEAIDRLSQGRTTLVIAHRFATIKDADEILVIADGQVKEKGTHEELLAKSNGLYHQLHEQQFQLEGKAS